RRHRLDRSRRQPQPQHQRDAVHPAWRAPARHQLGRKLERRARAGVEAPRHGSQAGAPQGDGAHRALQPAAHGVRRLHQRQGHASGRGRPRRVSAVPPPADLQKRVLVVDDSRFVRTTFAHILKTSFAVSEANDGEAAWTAINADPTIVMVFTDLDMPKLHGFGLLDRMRKSDDPRIKTLPVVVISGSEEPSSKQLEQTRMAVQSTATHDPLTGTHTPQYLVTEGRKHFAHARRHSGDLSVMALRLDTYESIVLAATKDIADIVVARIAKLVMEKVRAEDSVARVAQATFVVLAAGTAASHMAALAERLRRELDEARVTYREQALKFVTSVGVASLSSDP